MNAGIPNSNLFLKREVFLAAEPPFYSLVSILKILELVPPFKRCEFSTDDTKCRMPHSIWKFWIHWLFGEPKTLVSLIIDDTRYQKSTYIFFCLNSPRWTLEPVPQNKVRELMSSGRSRTVRWPEAPSSSSQGTGTCAGHAILKELNEGFIIVAFMAASQQRDWASESSLVHKGVSCQSGTGDMKNSWRVTGLLFVLEAQRS